MLGHSFVSLRAFVWTTRRTLKSVMFMLCINHHFVLINHISLKKNLIKIRRVVIQIVLCNLTTSYMKTFQHWIIYKSMGMFAIIMLSFYTRSMRAISFSTVFICNDAIWQLGPFCVFSFEIICVCNNFGTFFNECFAFVSIFSNLASHATHVQFLPHRSTWITYPICFAYVIHVL